MKINLDFELNIKLREKINEWHNFTYEKEAEFNFPGKKKKEIANAFNCICAALDRIDSLVCHCNSIDVTDDAYGLCDIFNYGQTLIDCITSIGQIYSVRYDVESCECFGQAGENGKGNDEKYFKYLRSLCSVHPLETCRHSCYQGEKPEWCAWVAANKNFEFCNELTKCDFIAYVYRNEETYMKKVPICVNTVFTYIEKRHAFIYEIIERIDAYNNERINKLSQKHIPKPNEFDSYINYLESLKEAVVERYGKYEGYHIDVWSTIFQTSYEDLEIQKKLFEYQEYLKARIQRLHDSIQNMDVDCYFDIESVAYVTDSVPSDFAYQVSKLNYLRPDWENEQFDRRRVLEEKVYNCEKLEDIFKIIENEKVETKAEVEELSRIIDSCFELDNFEWARVQLKMIEPYFEDVIKFDYYLGNWYLYLQVQIAFWMKSKNG